MPRQAGIKQPIRDIKKIQDCKDWLLVNKTFRDYLLFTVGLNTGLRISDLVKLKVSDVQNKDMLSVIQEKTKKETIIPLNLSIQKELNMYCKDKDENDYLFESRRGNHISTVMAHYILKEMADSVGIESFGTHTMRKSFGYHYYKETNDVYFLMKIFGHRNQSQTMSYIGVELDEIKESMMNFSL